MKHPAKYSDVLMPIFDVLLPKNGEILDCFAGTGKLKQIRPNCTLLEIEPEWAEMCGAIVGDATQMPFADCTFDAICTSPTYGNRMADSFIDHKPEKKYVRNTYTHCLGRKLAQNNTGGMQWGPAYKTLHIKAWNECWRVLKSGGMLVLNISDHIRAGKVVPVSNWHAETLQNIGFELKNCIKVETPRNRFGANRKLRVEHEFVFVFYKK
jgi:DNA modification methylase